MVIADDVQQLMVERRNGEVVEFSSEKIKQAIIEAAIAASYPMDESAVDVVEDEIHSELNTRFFDNEFVPNVENIHDIVEKNLMKANLFQVAKTYILNRDEKRRRDVEDRKKTSFLKQLSIVKLSGKTVPFDVKKLRANIDRCAKGLDDLDVRIILEETVKNIYDGMKTEEIEKVLLLAATSFIELEPNYSYLASRIFQQALRKEVFGTSTRVGTSEYEKAYRLAFIDGIGKGCDGELFDTRLASFDLVKLSKALVLERDDKFKYIGVQTLYERYFAKVNKQRIETPQAFWMRVAMGLAMNEENKEEAAIAFYEVMSEFHYIPSTPTLFHSGLTHPQLSSCYLTTVDDDLHHIFQCFSDNAQLAKWSGGIGTDWTPVRGTGANVGSTKIESQGVIPFLKISNDTTVAINRSGKRRGAACAYLETWHIDVEDFIDLRKNTGDERRRTHDMNTANWIPDLFMKRVKANADWTLFSPDETPDLHDLYGKAFEKRYLYYENQAKKGKIKKTKTVSADKLYKRILGMMFETGHPWLTFKDVCNIRSPQDHVGVIHSSNLCCVAGDQLVPTSNGFFTVRELHEQATPLKLVGRRKEVDATPMYLPRPSASLVKITTKEGYSHTVTPDHKVWLYDSQCYCEAQDLAAGDRVSLQSIPGLWGTTSAVDEAFLAGLWCGDGTTGDRSIHLDVWTHEFHLIPEIEAAVTRVIAKYDEQLDLGSRPYRQPTFGDGEEKRRLSSAALYKIFRYLGYYEKLSVPKFVLRGDQGTVSAFLKGLYICDGTVSSDEEITTMSLCSTSLKLLETLQIMWLNFGCKTSLTLMDAEGKRSLPDGKGGYALFDCKAKYRLHHTSIKACQIAENVTGLGQVRNCVIFIENLTKDGYAQKMWATVKEVCEAGTGDAYCPSVNSEDRLWSCNGLLTKNTEITLNTKPTKKLRWSTTATDLIELGEVAVCNLGSLNLVSFIIDGVFNREKLAEVIAVAMRILDNVIDLNFYPIPEAQNANMKHRPVGLGIMGYHDILLHTGINYEDSLTIGDELQEFISYHAISASSQLAVERGCYESYKGSKWDRGIFPFDTIELLEEERGMKTKVNRKSQMPWKELKEKVKRDGMRNSNLMAIAPTASISTIVGCAAPCFEPVFKNIYVKANMTGEFTVVNEFLIADLKKLGLWDKNMLDQIKYHDGSIQNIESIPDKLKAKYKDAFEVDPLRCLELTAARGKWIDQSQSHNVFLRGNSGKILYELYLKAWELGLKTTYYLRTLGVSQIEKSTLDTKFGLTQKREEPKLCRLDDPTCESCQ